MITCTVCIRVLYVFAYCMLTCTVRKHMYVFLCEYVLIVFHIDIQYCIIQIFTTKNLLQISQAEPIHTMCVVCTYIHTCLYRYC